MRNLRILYLSFYIFLIIFFLVFINKAGSYFNPFYLNIYTPSYFGSYGNYNFYTHASDNTLKDVLDKNLEKYPYVNVARSSNGGYTLSRGLNLFGFILLDTCMSNDLAFIINGYLDDIFNVVNVSKKTSEGVTYYYIYGGGYPPPDRGGYPVFGNGYPIFGVNYPQIITELTRQLMGTMPQSGIPHFQGLDPFPFLSIFPNQSLTGFNPFYFGSPFPNVILDNYTLFGLLQNPIPSYYTYQNNIQVSAESYSQPVRFEHFIKPEILMY